MDVFLDIGFTLMGGPKLSPPKKIRQVLELGDNSLETLSEIIFTERHCNPDSLISSVEKSIGIRMDRDQRHEITDFWRRQYTDVYEIEGATELLKNISNHRINIHIMSNLWFPFYEKFKTIFSDILSSIRSQTLSFREGVKKPSPDFYRMAFESSGAIPTESIMIGDSIANDIVPCAELDMNCIWFISRPLDRQSLETRRDRLAKYKNVYEATSLYETQSIIGRILLNEKSGRNPD